MRRAVLLAAFIAAGPAGNAASAQSAGRPLSVFSCSLGAKRVSVTAVGNQLIYSFGAVGRPEIQIVGSAANGNLFWQSDLFSRYAAYDQIRFTSGQFSYVVYDLIPTADGSGPAAAGLLVWRGRTKVAEFSCRERATVNARLVERMRLPDDSGQWFY
jgi:hypothetical protein